MLKKIFLINFSTPILKDVALRLQDEGAHIVYWQGYRDYFRSICRDKYNFPNTIFHYAIDSLRVIPPTEVDVSEFEPPSKDIIEKMHKYIGQILFLIDRADYSGFPLSQKRHLYYQYIKFWQGMLKKFQPNAILFPDVPHDGHTYVLYALAMIFKIKVIIAEQIAVESRTLLVNDYEKSSLALRDDYNKNQDKECRVEDLCPDLKEYYLEHITPNADATPEYQKRALRKKVSFRRPTVGVILRHMLHLSIFRVTFSYLRMLFIKNEEESLNGDLRGFNYALIMRKWVRINKSLEKEYISQQTAPDLTKKFIYMPLNIQPERTTCPEAGIFDDQLLMIETVARCLPKDWVLYVKENPNQLPPTNNFCHMYRYKGYYRYITKFSNVRLVPTDTSTYDLINHAQAVATGTGTAGWESLLRSKPVLVFGFVWYMYCDGVFRVYDTDSCRQALRNIENGFKPDRQKVLNYLGALDRNSLRARHFRTLHYKESNYNKNDYVSHDDNVKNLSQALSNAILC